MSTDHDPPNLGALQERLDKLERRVARLRTAVIWLIGIPIVLFLLATEYGWYFPDSVHTHVVKAGEIEAKQIRAREITVGGGRFGGSIELLNAEGDQVGSFEVFPDGVTRLMLTRIVQKSESGKHYDTPVELYMDKDEVGLLLNGGKGSRSQFSLCTGKNSAELRLVGPDGEELLNQP